MLQSPLNMSEDAEFVLCRSLAHRGQTASKGTVSNRGRRQDERKNVCRSTASTQWPLTGKHRPIHLNYIPRVCRFPCFSANDAMRVLVVAGTHPGPTNMRRSQIRSQNTPTPAALEVDTVRCMRKPQRGQRWLRWIPTPNYHAR